jgi:Zn-dependent protease with chaperone function
MQFLERQEAARQRTQLLGAQFAVVSLVALAITLSLAFALGLLLTFVELSLVSGSVLAGKFIPMKALIFGAIFHVAFLIPVAVHMTRTQSGDVLRDIRDELDARTNADSKGDPSFRRLLNVVEEMALASGIPAPRVRLWRRYRAINAVTLGLAPADATIYVTGLAADGLSRAELQAMVAYSMSQILNGDMALNVRLASLVHALSAGPRLARWLVSLPKAPLRHVAMTRFFFWLLICVPAGLALAAVAWPLYLAARYLQSRVGRERQRLGDASVIQFTRDQQPFEDLLHKALAYTISNRRLFLPALVHDFAHCCFVVPGKPRFLSPQDSLADRLRALNPRLDVPHFTGEELDRFRLDVRERVSAARKQLEERRSRPAPELAAMLLATVPAEPAASPKLVPETGRLLHLDEPTIGLVALLVDRNPATRGRQVAELANWLDEFSSAAVATAAEKTVQLSISERSLAVDTCLPHLRTIPRKDLDAVRDCVVALEFHDAAVDAFEYALTRSVLAFIDGFTRPQTPHGAAAFEELLPELGVLFSVLASFSSREHAPRAFEAGMRHLSAATRANYRSPQNWVRALDAALERLRTLMPIAKNLLLEALEKTVMSDGFNTLAERELVRAIGTCLRCSMPRALSGRQAAVNRISA